MENGRATPDDGEVHTSWTAIQSGDLDYVIRRFWSPVYRYLAPRLGADDAEEATQEFFLRFVDRQTLEHFDPQRGRARNFVFHLVKQFLIDLYRQRGAAKRGGDRKNLGGDVLEELATAQQHPSFEFDREWFHSLIHGARRAVKATYVSRGNPTAYRAFRLFYFATERRTQAQVAEALGIPVTQVNNYLHRCRRVYSEAIRLLVADYCPPDEIDREMGELGAFLEEHRLPGPPPSTYTQSPPPE